MIHVKVKYWKGGFYSGAEYTYKTALPLAPGDKVIAPTAKELRQRGIVTEINVPAPSFPCKEITEYDPEQEVLTVD